MNGFHLATVHDQVSLSHGSDAVGVYAGSSYNGGCGRHHRLRLAASPSPCLSMCLSRVCMWSCCYTMRYSARSTIMILSQLLVCESVHFDDVTVQATTCRTAFGKTIIAKKNAPQETWQKMDLLQQKQFNWLQQLIRKNSNFIKEINKTIKHTQPPAFGLGDRVQILRNHLPTVSETVVANKLVDHMAAIDWPPGKGTRTYFRGSPIDNKSGSDGWILEKSRATLEFLKRTYSDFGIFNIKSSIYIQKVSFGELDPDKEDRRRALSWRCRDAVVARSWDPGESIRAAAGAPGPGPHRLYV
ncbi:hypothetical protein MSG28_004412 [Choristoneura fumiferana]|uniref:Uncharacterized protein n=1 Tax=Choristoneura fumiferana TaxID=7141 RepID=A0ACC0K5V8_CHOFU|nr:hypothetical protein MSG28_004412 [Choristoneura fumiferana]